MRFSDVQEDPEAAIAARALDRTLRERYFARLQEFYDTRGSYPREWQEVTGGSDNTNAALMVNSGLGPYINKTANAYHCPADSVLSDVQRQAGWTGRVRMSGALQPADHCRLRLRDHEGVDLPVVVGHVEAGAGADLEHPAGGFGQQVLPQGTKPRFLALAGHPVIRCREYVLT